MKVTRDVKPHHVPRVVSQERAQNPDMGRSIALYFHRLGGNGGGAERIIIGLANAMSQRGFAVHLLTWDDEIASTFYPVDESVVWHRLGFSSGIMDKLRRTKAMCRVFREHKVRVLVGFVMSTDKTVFAAAKASGVSVIVAERNAPTMYSLRYGFFMRWSSFLFLHLADYITVQIPSYVNGYPATLRRRIRVIPNPVPVVSRYVEPARPNKDGRFTLLAVVSLDPVQKGLTCLIKAFSKIADDLPDWDLRIIGEGPEKDALQHLAKLSGLAGRISIEKSVKDIFSVYRESHLFIMPSLWEGFPNALAEALSYGLPAVGFEQAAGVADLISLGGGGWLAPGLNSEVTLAATLKSAIGDTEERIRRGRLARESMKKFQPEKIFDQWMDLVSNMEEARC